MCVGTDSIHGPDDWCSHVPFASCMHGSAMVRLGHDLHVRMHPFQVPQHKSDGLGLGRFSKNAQHSGVALWCAALSMELMIDAGMLHLPWWCVATD